MANFSLPTTGSLYTSLVTELNSKISDLALGLDPATSTPTNVPTNSVRWSSAANKWQKWNGSSWVDLASVYAISVSGNSATATTLASARAINGTNFNGADDIITSLWGAARLLTIGNTGKSVNGSAAVSWSLAELGISVPMQAVVAATSLPLGRDALGVPASDGTGATGSWPIVAQNVSGVVAIANGGTGAATAPAAFAALKQQATTTDSGVVALATGPDVVLDSESKVLTPAAYHAARRWDQVELTVGLVSSTVLAVIPAWVTRVDLVFRNISATATANLEVVVDGWFGVQTNSSNNINYNGTTVTHTRTTTGIRLVTSASAALNYSGILTLEKASSVWVASGSMSSTTTAVTTVITAAEASPGDVLVFRCSTGLIAGGVIFVNFR